MSAYRRLSALLLIFSALGCDEEVNCDDLESRLNRCRNEVYHELAPAPAGFLDEITAPQSNVSASSREKIKTAWTEKKTKLSAELTDEITRKCTKHKGRFHFSQQINDCLKKKDCSDFAECFRKTVSKKK